MIVFIAECPVGSYGTGCTKQCACKNEAQCDPVSGQCKCTKGNTTMIQNLLTTTKVCFECSLHESFIVKS